MKNNTRMIRINDEIKRELSEIVRSELKDPRIGVMTSILKVETTNDLKYCKVYVSVLGDEKQKSDVIEGLKNASGFIRKQVAMRINLRNTPQFKFEIDDSLEYSIKISKLIDEVNKSE
ncbi:30S ribosome-binding factor RbfA [[Clostridium] colinum]|uniref:30S ribosome-binding factor RbfA n=1 Tax=[Clostridium] colinum TaxID=36835 RepID=UPI002024ACAE|nr:30S ribosome-binding factor RbfA [[Clostridium] colinum]